MRQIVVRTALGLGLLVSSRARAQVVPANIAVDIASEPAGAAVTVKAGAATLTGTTPFTAEVPPGPVQLAFTHEGSNPLQVDEVVAGKTTLRYWLDPAGQLVHKRRVFDTGKLPKQIALTHDGKQAWVASLDGPPSLYVHDLATGQKLEDLTLGEHGAVEVIFNADDTRAYVSQMETALVYEIDVATRKVLRTLPTKGKWSKVLCLSADGKKLFVSNWLGHNISEIDLGSGKVLRKIETVQTPRGLYATRDGKTLYVAGFEKGELARIDLAKGTSETIFDKGAALRHIVGDEDKGVLYISDMGKGCVWKLVLKTGKVTRLAGTDQNPNTIALSPDKQVLVVSCRGKNGPGGYLTVSDEAGSVLFIDVADGHLLDAVVAGKQPTALDLSSDGKLAAFSDFRDDRIEVYDLPTTEQLRAGGGGRAAVYRSELSPKKAAAAKKKSEKKSEKK